jgi:hypothetical protein
MWGKELDPNEQKAVAVIVAEYARQNGEDFIGAILKTGAFRELTEYGPVVLATKLAQLIDDRKE